MEQLHRASQFFLQISLTHEGPRVLIFLQERALNFLFVQEKTLKFLIMHWAHISFEPGLITIKDFLKFDHIYIIPYEPKRHHGLILDSHLLVMTKRSKTGTKKLVILYVNIPPIRKKTIPSNYYLRKQKKILIRASVMVLPKKKSLEKVYFGFLSIIFFLFQIKKYINQSRIATYRGDPRIVQGFTKKEFLFRNFKD